MSASPGELAPVSQAIERSHFGAKDNSKTQLFFS
jgi:hypothetical protein